MDYAIGRIADFDIRLSANVVDGAISIVRAGFGDIDVARIFGRNELVLVPLSVGAFHSYDQALFREFVIYHPP